MTVRAEAGAAVTKTAPVRAVASVAALATSRLSEVRTWISQLAVATGVNGRAVNRCAGSYARDAPSWRI
jgi:hypothetical protein